MVQLPVENEAPPKSPQLSPQNEGSLGAEAPPSLLA